jgi:hypothetical protein
MVIVICARATVEIERHPSFLVAMEVGQSTESIGLRGIAARIGALLESSYWSVTIARASSVASDPN